MKLFIARNAKKMGGTIQQCTKIAPSAVPWDFHRIRLKKSKEKTALDVHTRNKINKSKIQTDENNFFVLISFDVIHASKRSAIVLA